VIAVDVKDVRGHAFGIVGAARSGIAVARLLNNAGAHVLVSDAAPETARPEAAAALRRLNIACEFGGNSPRLLESRTLVISPGVPSNAPIVQQAAEHGIGVVSELEVASWFVPGPIVAITGTNGKTTTTTLTGRIFEDAKRPVAVAGNIGRAFSDVVEGLTPAHTVVLEVSSFQLDHVDTFRPRVAVILNITPDHLDRYRHDFGLYVASKCRIVTRQGSGDTVIYNVDDDVTRTAVEQHLPAGVNRLPFSVRETLDRGAWMHNGVMKAATQAAAVEIVPAAAISIRGTHNLYNAMAATLAALSVGVPAASVRATLRNFKGVEHRLEFVREVNGVTYINDSKATNVDSVWYALQSYSAPLIVLMGGRDKGNDYNRLVDLVHTHVKAIIAIGESSAKVRQAFAAVVPVDEASTMNDAVRFAAARAGRGDIVLLSPACASFDWFTDYEHRGRVFKEIVRQLPVYNP
jgi:UDP-N-acetylmuramoylalanine--D-glutamate ligase